MKNERFPIQPQREVYEFGKAFYFEVPQVDCPPLKEINYRIPGVDQNLYDLHNLFTKKERGEKRSIIRNFYEEE